MKTPGLSDLAASAAADAVVALLDDGYLRIYSGKQPADPNAEAPREFLAELWFTAPAFQKATEGQAIANEMEPETSAPASGEASWFRAFTLDSRPVFDGSAGTVDVNLVLDRSRIIAGDTVSIETLVYSQLKDKE